MRSVQLLLITIHITAAAIWLGAMGFLGLILVPELRRCESGLRSQLLAATGRRLRTLAWILYLILVTTGLLQLWLRGYRASDLSGPLWQGPSGTALTWKLTLFAVVVCIALWHDFYAGSRALVAQHANATSGATGANTATERWRRFASVAGRILFLLGLAIVYCSVTFVRGGFL